MIFALSHYLGFSSSVRPLELPSFAKLENLEDFEADVRAYADAFTGKPDPAVWQSEELDLTPPRNEQITHLMQRRDQTLEAWMKAMECNDWDDPTVQKETWNLILSPA